MLGGVGINDFRLNLWLLTINFSSYRLQLKAYNNIIHDVFFS